MYLLTFRPFGGDTETLVCLGTFSQILIGLYRNYGQFQLYYSKVIPEQMILELDGMFRQADYRAS